jgi:hypothetical protein
MATLNFSFAGESINAAKLESKVRKFELEFENPAYAQLKQKTTFSVEHFFSINKYAENLSEAFHMAAKESGVVIDRLSIHIMGNLDSERNSFSSNGNGLFNKIDVALIIVSDASDAVLEGVLRFANELNPVDDDLAGNAQFHFSLNSIVHLN